MRPICQGHHAGHSDNLHNDSHGELKNDYLGSLCREYFEKSTIPVRDFFTLVKGISVL